MAATKKPSLNRRYHHFDAQGKVVGRLATRIAKILSGRDRVDYTPHQDKGDFVVVTNTDGLTLTGTKTTGKMYHQFSGYPGGMLSLSFEEQMARDSRKVLMWAVRGMLPKNKLRAHMLRRLRLYKGTEHQEKTIHITHA